MAPMCNACGNALEYVDLAAGATNVVGKAPLLYLGVVCVTCHKVECADCAGGKGEKPCRWCGGATRPAFETHLRELGVAPTAAGRRPTAPLSEGWVAFGGFLVLFAGIGGLLGGVALYPEPEPTPYQSLPAAIAAATFGLLSFALAAVLARFNAVTVVLFESWRLLLSVGMAVFMDLSRLDDAPGSLSVGNRVGFTIYAIGFMLLLTWPISRAMRRKRRARSG